MALDVVTNEDLVRYIAAFQRGLPKDLVDIELPWTARSLPKLAMRNGDCELLKRLVRYQTEQPEFCRQCFKMNFRGAWLEAILNRQMPLAVWLDSQQGIDSGETADNIWTRLLEEPAEDIIFIALFARPGLKTMLLPEHIHSLVVRNQLATLEFLESQAVMQYTDEVLLAAVESGILAMIEFLHKRNLDNWTPVHMDKAAAEGHLDIVLFLHEHRTEGCTVAGMDEAAANGRIDLVRFLHEHRTEGCSTAAMDRASAAGHIEVVRFLHEHRTEGCTTEAVDGAAANGRVDIVEYLLVNRQEGCTDRAMKSAIVANRYAVVRVLHEHFCPQPGKSRGQGNLTEVDLNLVKDLFEKNPTRGPLCAMCTAATKGQQAIVEFLHIHYHACCTKEVAREAADMGRVAVVQFLVENCDAVDRSALVRAAVNSGETKMVEYAVQVCADEDLTEGYQLAQKRGLSDVVAILSNAKNATTAGHSRSSRLCGA